MSSFRLNVRPSTGACSLSAPYLRSAQAFSESRAQVSAIARHSGGLRALLDLVSVLDSQARLYLCQNTWIVRPHVLKPRLPSLRERNVDYTTPCGFESIQTASHSSSREAARLAFRVRTAPLWVRMANGTRNRFWVTGMDEGSGARYLPGDVKLQDKVCKLAFAPAQGLL